MAQQRKELINSLRVFKGTTEKVKWLGAGEKSQQDKEAASAWALGPKGAPGPYSEPITPGMVARANFPHTARNPRRVAELDLISLLKPLQIAHAILYSLNI